MISMMITAVKRSITARLSLVREWVAPSGYFLSGYTVAAEASLKFIASYETFYSVFLIFVVLSKNSVNWKTITTAHHSRRTSGEACCL